MVVTVDLSVVYILICFLLIFWVASRTLFRPLDRILAQRREEIASARELDESNRAEAEKILADYDGKIAKARSAGFSVRQGLRESAAQAERGLIEKARREAARKLESAQARLERELEESKRSLADESEEMAEGVAAAVLGGRR